MRILFGRVPLTAALVAASMAASAPVPALLSAPTDLSLTETPCDGRASLAITLRRDFAEAPTLETRTGTGLAMEIWTSDRLGTWTVLHHAPDGISCIVTTGLGWTAGGDAVLLLDRALGSAVYDL